MQAVLTVSVLLVSQTAKNSGKHVHGYQAFGLLHRGSDRSCVATTTAALDVETVTRQYLKWEQREPRHQKLGAEARPDTMLTPLMLVPKHCFEKA